MSLLQIACTRIECWFSFVINRNLAPKIQQISYPGCHFSGSPGTVEFWIFLVLISFLLGQWAMAQSSRLPTTWAKVLKVLNEQTKGLFIWKWETSGRWGPYLGGIQSIHTISLFFLIVSHLGGSAGLGNLLKWGESSPSESCRVG